MSDGHVTTARPWRRRRDLAVLMVLVVLCALLLEACASGRILSPTPRQANPSVQPATAGPEAGPLASQPAAPAATRGSAGLKTARPAKASSTPLAKDASAAAGLGIPTPLPGDRMTIVHFATLPTQAQDVIGLIRRGGPFKYRQDGITFENRERLLPIHPSGYYHEYTVETPGSPDRGPRRIVSGEQGELYYTSDHYASFKRVAP